MVLKKLGLKKFWGPQKLWGQTILGLQNTWMKQILGSKKIWGPQKKWVQKNFGVQKILK